MAALPYMQIYWGDYFADTPHLSTEEHGAYLLLIAAYWQRGKSLPVKQLKSITKLSNERWTDVEPTLNEFFTVDESGCWFHERIEQELDKVRAKIFGLADSSGRLPWAEWNVLREYVFKRDNYTCRYCQDKSDALECDHINPVLLGGTNELNNLATSCGPCNRSKGAKTLEQWKPGVYSA